MTISADDEFNNLGDAEKVKFSQAETAATLYDSMTSLTSSTAYAPASMTPRGWCPSHWVSTGAYSRCGSPTRSATS